MAAPTRRAGITLVAGLSVTSGAGTAVGDMVIVATWERAGAGVPTHTLQSNFVELFSQAHDDGSTDGRLSVAYKIATASGAQSYQAYTSSVGTETWSGGIVVQVGTFSATATNKGPTASAGVSQTNNAVPNPPSVTLGTARDWLVIVFGGWHHSTSATITPTAPTNYTNLIEVAGSTTGDLGIADRTLTAPASEDPGTFGDNIAPNGTAAVTVGVGSIVVTTRTVAVDGAGGIATAATFFSIFERATAIGATADIAVSGVVVPGITEHERAVAVDAVGAIASSGGFFTVFERTTATDAVGAIESSGVFFSVFERTSATDAAGGITTVGQRDLLRVVVTTATADISVDGHGILERSVALNATASVDSSAVFFTTFERSLAVDAVGSITVTRQVELQRSVAVDGIGGIATNGHKVEPETERSASLEAVAVIETSAQFWSVFERGVSLSAIATVNIVHQRELSRTVTEAEMVDAVNVSGSIVTLPRLAGQLIVGAENRIERVANGGRMQLANGLHGTVLPIGSESHVL